MRKLLLFLLLLIPISLLTPAQVLGKNIAGKKTVIHGFLVDLACTRERADEKGELGLVHTKKCLQMPACERSGYAVMDSHQNVYKFDASGNEQAKKLIAATDKDKDWRIIAYGRLQGDQLTVAKLQIQN